MAEGGSLQEIQVQQIPNIFTLKEISYCSPPQISRPVSYPPSSQNHFLSTANSPPAITGDLQDTQNATHRLTACRTFSTTALYKTISRKSCSVYFCLRSCNERFTRLFTKNCKLLHIVQLLKGDRWRWRNQGNNHESSMETSKYIKYELSVHHERTKITDVTICARNVRFPLCVKTLWMKLFRKAKYNTCKWGLK